MDNKDKQSESDSSEPSMQTMEMEDPRMNDKVPYPKGVFFIMATELAERFSYYGMRAVLTIYMRNMLDFSEDRATSFYHVFLLLCYGLPIVWGVISDSWLGKFKTILIVSILFAIGNVILAVSSVSTFNLPTTTLFFVGLILMAVGTGGMKPCVCPLGAEQYVVPQQSSHLQQFFSVFFFVVTIGNMVSTIITPIFRRDVQCDGQESCYPLAFGVPAGTMIFAVVIFGCGRLLYKVNDPSGNMLVKVIKCTTYALTNRKKKSKDPDANSHWLDPASGVFEENIIADTKGLIRVLPYFLPVPMFFALYEQLGSRWTLQATRMNGKIGGFSIKPDQMQVSNAILMFVSLPLFNLAVYPLLGKMGIKLKSLQRMVVGGVLAALSFAAAGVVAMQIDPTIRVQPSDGTSVVTLVNAISCPINVTMTSNKPQKNSYSIRPNSFFQLNAMNYSESTPFFVETLNENCSNLNGQEIPLKGKWSDNNGIKILPRAYQTIAITEAIDHSVSVRELPFKDDFTKSKDGNARVRFVVMEDPTLSTFQLKNFNETSVRIILKSSKGIAKLTKYIVLQPSENKYIWFSETEEIDEHTYDVSYEVSNVVASLKSGVELENGGSYNFITFANPANINQSKSILEVIAPPNSIHILWQVPQYALMAWGEIFFIVSGMEFAYTEAPVSMKSVVQAIWHLMNAFGNLIVIISAQNHHGDSSQTNGFFIFGGVMLLDSIIYYLMARRYNYVAFEAGGVVMH